MSLVGIIDYYMLGIVLDDVSNYIYDYQCGECGMKYIKNQKCNNCKNITHFHNMNCFSHVLRKIIKCKKCDFKKCDRCNIKYTKSDNICHKCKVCHVKDETLMFCNLCNKCVNPYIHSPYNSVCNGIKDKKQI